MLSHDIPSTDRAQAQSPDAEMRPASARSRAQGPRGGSISVPLHPSLRRQGANLDSVGHALIAEIDALLQTMPPYSPARDAFATALLGMSEILRLDAEGRVFFEERLKSALGLDGEAVFVGQGHKFQIWEPARFQTHLDEARARVRRLRAEREALASGETPR